MRWLTEVAAPQSVRPAYLKMSIILEERDDRQGASLGAERDRSGQPVNHFADLRFRTCRDRGGGSSWVLLARSCRRPTAAVQQQPSKHRASSSKRQEGGGGANAVHFAPLAETYVGIDIARPSLQECANQLDAAGFRNFEPVLLDAGAPDTALAQIAQKCDLFLSTYVFELLPTPEYGLQVLKIARKLLNEGGMAIIQIRYTRDSWTSRPKRFAYKRNLSSMTTYRIKTFWEEAEKCGFLPQAVRLVPREKLNDQTNYAYFMFTT